MYYILIMVDWSTLITSPSSFDRFRRISPAVENPMEKRGENIKPPFGCGEPSLDHENAQEVPFHVLDFLHMHHMERRLVIE
jgi:hypothetical protein